MHTVHHVKVMYYALMIEITSFEPMWGFWLNGVTQLSASSPSRLHLTQVSADGERVAGHSSAPEVLTYAHEPFHLWLLLDRGRCCIFVYIALLAKLEVSGCLHMHLDRHSAECNIPMDLQHICRSNIVQDLSYGRRRNMRPSSTGRGRRQASGYATLTHIHPLAMMSARVSRCALRNVIDGLQRPRPCLNRQPWARSYATQSDRGASSLLDQAFAQKQRDAQREYRDSVGPLPLGMIRPNLGGGEKPKKWAQLTTGGKGACAVLCVRTRRVLMRG
jgi:hypothetical protein